MLELRRNQCDGRLNSSGSQLVDISSSIYNRFLLRLRKTSPLLPSDCVAFSRIPPRLRNLESGETIVREGQQISECFIILQGHVIGHKASSETRRQILSLHLSGDMPNFVGLDSRLSNKTLSALGPVTIVIVSNDCLKEIANTSANFARALWQSALAESEIYQQWISVLGNADSISRVAHLLCEIAVRLRAVDLAENLDFPMPWTQSDIADACGISPVHVNRTIQALRGQNVIRWKSRSLQILRWEELQRIGNFAPDYLHAGI